MAFGLQIFNVAPGLRLMGDSVAYAYKFTKKGGVADGTEGLEIGLTDDPAVKLLEEAVSGFIKVDDRDAVYVALAAGGLTEIVPGLLVGIDSLASIDTSDVMIKLGVAGAQPTLQFRKANVQAVTKVGDSGYVWDVPAGTFDVLKLAADGYDSNLAAKVDEMIAARISADGVLQAAIDGQATSDATARALMQADIDQNEADADAAIAAEATTRETNDNTIIASVDAEATARENADTALSGRLDALEADPITATASAAADAATLTSANTYTDTSVAAEATTRANGDNALSARLDTLEADPTTQTLLDAESTARTSADTALSGRLDTLEADPTTAAAVAAVQADVDQNETDGDAADAALSGRLDVLEADPTTATAVAAVQSDVDQNEADADAALALKAPLADPDFTGVLEVDTNARLEFDSNLTKLHNVLRGTSIQLGNNIQLYPAAADGRVEIEGGLYLRPSDMGNYANDTDAANGGVVVGGIYHHNGTLRIRLS